MTSSRDFGPKDVTVSISRRGAKVPVVLLQDQFTLEASALRALIVWSDEDRVQVRILTDVKGAAGRSSVGTGEVELLRLSYERKSSYTNFRRVTG